jgi:hypothetical protein
MTRAAAVAALTALTACGLVACGSDKAAEAPAVDKPSHETFKLSDGDFVTFPPGEVEQGDKIVCEAAGMRAKIVVPDRGVGVSSDPAYVAVSDDGSARAECGGIHAETVVQP